MIGVQPDSPAHWAGLRPLLRFPDVSLVSGMIRDILGNSKERIPGTGIKKGSPMQPRTPFLFSLVAGAGFEPATFGL